MRQLFNRAILTVLVAAPVAQGTPPPNPIDSAEAAALRARSDPSLGSMRAGWAPERTEISEYERAALRSAEAASPKLGEMRGGFVGTVLVAVLLVIVILLLI